MVRARVARSASRAVRGLLMLLVVVSASRRPHLTTHILTAHHLTTHTLTARHLAARHLTAQTWARTAHGAHALGRRRRGRRASVVCAPVGTRDGHRKRRHALRHVLLR
jgi:hypothetical protein